MKKKQLDLWLLSHKSDPDNLPKVFVVGCADLSCYSLAVEYKHRLEPIKAEEGVVYFSSLEVVKQELKRLGLISAYLRLHNAYDEFGSDEVCTLHQDIELLLAS